MSLRDNPVYQRENRRRFRSAQFLLGWVLGYSLFLGTIITVAALGMFFFKKFSGQSPGFPFGGSNNKLGHYLLMTLFWFQQWIFFFTVPGMSAASIKTEREKKTLHMTLISQLTPTDIMLGKLVSLFLFVGVLIISSIPITALAFQFGGASWSDFFTGYLTLILGVLYYTGCGIGASGMCEKTSSATMITYALIAALYFASSIIPMSFRFISMLSPSSSTRFWIGIYPWIVLSIKVMAGLALLAFGWHKVKTYELVG